MTMIGLFFAAAHAEISLPEAEAMYAKAISAFEDEMMLTFSPPPPLVVSDVEEATLAFVEEYYRANRSTSQEQLFLMAQELQNMFEQFPAYYNIKEKKIYLMEDTLEDLERDLDLGPAEAWLPCILAHELTHALQHQLGWLTERTVIEGHANHVGARVCEEMALPEGLALMVRMHRPIPGLVPQTLAEMPEEGREELVGYGYSWVFFDDVYAREGDAGVEAMLLDPPTPEEIVAHVVAPYPQIYWDPEKIQAACRWLGRGADEVDAASAILPGMVVYSDTIRTGQGCAASRDVRGRSRVGAILFRDARAAAALMAGYRSAPGSGGFFYFAGEVEVPGADEAFMLERSASVAVFARVGERVIIAEKHGGLLNERLAVSVLAELIDGLPEPPR